MNKLIVGAVVGGVIFAGTVVGTVIYRKHKKKKENAVALAAVESTVTILKDVACEVKETSSDEVLSSEDGCDQRIAEMKVTIEQEKRQKEKDIIAARCEAVRDRVSDHALSLVTHIFNFDLECEILCAADNCSGTHLAVLEEEFAKHKDALNEEQLVYVDKIRKLLLP